MAMLGLISLGEGPFNSMLKHNGLVHLVGQCGPKSPLSL